jgi:hypothetical protein
MDHPVDRARFLVACAALAAACSKPATSAIAPRASAATVRDQAPLAPLCRQPATARAPLEDPQIAALVLEGYSAVEHRARVFTRAAPSTADSAAEFGVRDCAGETLWTNRRSDVEPEGTVRLASRSGEDWAHGMRLSWITVGRAPGLCDAEQGFLALVSGSEAQVVVVGLTAWEGSCQTGPHAVRFLTAARQRLILEADGDAGEDSTTERWDRVWLLTNARLTLAGRLRTHLEEIREPWSVSGFRRSMAASIEAIPAGLLVHEAWHFSPLAPNRTALTRTIERVVRFDAGRLLDAPDPDPLPEARPNRVPP